MGLTPGFKASDVGPIPPDWNARLLGALARFRTGPFGSALHKSDYTTDGIPVINPMHIVDGALSPTESMTITEAAACALADFRLREGDVVIGRRGDMGRCAVVRADHAGWLCGTGSMILRCASDLDPSFLQLVLSSPRAVAAIESASVGSTMINLNQGTLSALPVQVPPLPEQKAIAAALSDVDTLLAALDRLIAKKRDLKQAAMQQVLSGQTRLPGFNGKWETTRLGSICDIGMGRTPSRLVGAYWGRGHTWLSIADLQTKIVTDSAEQITDAGAEGMPIVPKGTLLMSFKLSIGRLCFAGRDLYTNEAICSFQRLQADPQYLYYALGRTDFSKYGKQAVKGYTLNKESLRLIEVALPDLNEQAAIAGALSDMDAELTAIEQRRDKTSLLKQGMMQELLTGRTRLV